MKRLAALVFALALAACAPRSQFKGTDVSRVTWGHDFTLTDQTGQAFNTASLRGKVVLLFFGYTHCPDICAPTLTRLAAAMRELGPKARGAQVVFVTVDPAHDTPARLAAFLQRFDPSFIGLTGTLAQVQTVAADYKIYRAPSPGHPGQFDHTGGVFLKDPQGKLRVYLTDGASPADIAHDVRLLLGER